MMYVAIIEAKYRVIAIAGTQDEARDAACRAYRKSLKMGTNLPVADIHTDEEITDYFGVNVYGPIEPGAGITE